MSFPANYPGVCDDCDHDILKGQDVEYNSAGELVHMLCPVGPANVVRDMCVTCFTELPVTGRCGSCD